MAALLGKSRSTVYRLIARDRLRSIKEGRRIFVDAAALQALISRSGAEPIESMAPVGPPEPTRHPDAAATPLVPAGHGQRELTVPVRRGPSVTFFFL